MKSFKRYALSEDIVKLPSGQFMLLSPDGASMGVFDTRREAVKRQRQIDFYNHVQDIQVEELDDTELEERCWKGYKPTPGKKAYEKGSCMKEGEAIELSPSVSHAAKLFSKFLRSTGAPDKVAKFTPNSKGVYIGKSSKFNYAVDLKHRTVTSQSLSASDGNTYVWDDKTGRVKIAEASAKKS